MERKIKNHEQTEEEQEKPALLDKKPIKIIVAVFLLLMVSLWTYSFYGVKLDPAPSRIPEIDEVLPYKFVSTEKPNITFYEELVKPGDPFIKQTADSIAVYSCSGNQICYAKAIYYFIRDKYQYISDPVDQEYVEDPKEFLSIGGGDCESGSIALANLLQAVGIYTEFVYAPRHVFIKARLPEAASRYRIKDYVYLDWTCKSCRFGEIPIIYRAYI